jgi:LacI family transcriptional regulator
LLIENPMASGRQVLDGVAKYADQRGGWSFYFQMGHFSNTLPDWLKYWRGDGILARIRSRRTATVLRELNIPIVDLLGDVPDLGIPSVGIDHKEVATLAANHLMEQGFCSFGFCGIRGAWWPRWRYNFFRKALATFGYNLHVYWLPMHTAVAWSTEAERIRLTRWITKLPKPIGILGCNDLAAQKVLEACRQAGVLTPEEVAVLGVDNDEEYICRFSDPTLSSIDAGHERFGQAGARPSAGRCGSSINRCPNDCRQRCHCRRAIHSRECLWRHERARRRRTRCTFLQHLESTVSTNTFAYHS